MSVKKTKGIISTILILSGLLSFITGTVLYFLNYGMWLCFTRDFLNDIHALSGLIMGIMVITHFCINRRAYLAEMRTLLKGKEP